MNKRIIVSIIVLFFIGLAIFIWFYRTTLFPEQAEEEKVYKVAAVLLGGAYWQAIDGMKDEMENIGYIEGKNIVYYIKDTGGNQETIAPATEELLQEKPDLFYVVSTPVTTRAWKVVGNEMPIVFNIVGDPIGPGFAKSFSSSETNLTGCTNLSAQLSGKRLEVFKEAFPSIKKVITFYDPDNKFSQFSIANTREAAPKVGVEVSEIQVKTVDDIKEALAAIKLGEYDGIYLTPDAMVISQVGLVVERAKELRLPVMGHEETLAESGATVTYGANFYKLGVQCAPIVDKILRGVKPQEISIQGPRTVDTVINLKTAQEAGLIISEEILRRADRVIQ